MDQGIYFNIPEGEYHSLEYLSGSTLKRLLKSPLHSTVPVEKTASMEFGTLAHLAILQPDVFSSKKVVMPKFDRRTKEGKAQYEAFQKSLGADSVMITQEDDERVTNMVKMLDIDWAKKIQAGKPEVTLIWDMPESITTRLNIPKVKCKARIDLLIDNHIVEFKTSTDASLSSFSKTIANQKYHLSAAWYIWGYSLITGVPLDSITYEFLVQETDAPYDYATYVPDYEMLDIGWHRAEEALMNYELGLRTNFTAGYQKSGQSISLPLYELSSF